jgi:hypothetical protein
LNIDTTVYEPIACIALGYLGDPEQLEETLKIRETEPRKRKKIDEISKLI